jgi:hypothetical protein
MTPTAPRRGGGDPGPSRSIVLLISSFVSFAPADLTPRTCGHCAHTFAPSNTRQRFCAFACASGGYGHRRAAARGDGR